MVMRMSWTTLIISSALVAVQGSVVKVSPMQKVVTLLKDLSTKIAAEGKKEAAEYDKFGCFCKEQEEQKLYAMKKSAKKIKYLEAERDQLKADADLLNNDAIDIGTRIAEMKTDIEQKTADRADQHEKYLKSARDMSEATGACSAAIDTLKNSKQDMQGAKLDLIQVTTGLVKTIKKQPLLANHPDAGPLFSLLDEEGAPKYEYHSNEVIATLQKLLAGMNDMKKDLDVDEFKAKAMNDGAILGLVNEQKFAEKRRNEKLAIADSKSSEHADRMDQIKDENEDLAEDKAYKDRLTDECEKAAEVFDQRSQIRASELGALGKVTEKLESGAAPNYKANKRLAGIQTRAIGKPGRMSSGPVTLVQIDSVQHQASSSRTDADLQRVRSYLSDAADRTGSSALSAVAVRVGLAATRRSKQKGGEDHFEAVRGILVDLMNKLESDATSEATTKESCDKGIAKSTSKRDKANAEIEAANAKLTALSANQNELQTENAQLSGQIAELMKAKLEANELADENVDNLNVQIGMCNKGVAALEFALTELQNFYSVGVSQPTQHTHDIASNSYHGAQSEAAGILGILEVIMTDFTRSLRHAQSDKDEAQTMQTDFNKETELDVKEKNGLIEKNKAAENGLVEIGQNLIVQEENLSDANKLLDAATKELVGWHSMCVAGEETWEERAQKRQDEVEALKMAGAILDDWQA